MAVTDNTNDKANVKTIIQYPPSAFPRKHSRKCSTTSAEVAGLENLAVAETKHSTEVEGKCADIEADNNNGKEPSKTRSGLRGYIGIGFGICASISFSLALLMVKMLSEYRPLSIGVWRFFGALVPSFITLLYYRYLKQEPVLDSIWPLDHKSTWKIAALLVIRAILGCTASVLQFYAVGYMTLADCIVIAFSTPLFVGFIARIFLGEKLGIVPIFTAVFALLGVGVITRPPLLTGQQGFDADNLFGAILAFSSMLNSTLIFVLLRYLREVHFSLVNTVFGLVGTIECLVVGFIFAETELPRDPFDWFLGTSVALLTFIGVSTLTLAFKFEQAGPISLVRTLDVIFAYIWQFIFLGVAPDFYSLLGSFIVIGGIVLIAIRKGLSTLPEDNPHRIRFWFLLK